MKGEIATLRELRCQRRAVLGRMRELEAQKRTYRESLGRGAADLQPAAFWGRFFDEYKEAVDEYLELGNTSVETDADGSRVENAVSEGNDIASGNDNFGGGGTAGHDATGLHGFYAGNADCEDTMAPSMGLGVAARARVGGSAEAACAAAFIIDNVLDAVAVDADAGWDQGAREIHPMTPDADSLQPLLTAACYNNVPVLAWCVQRRRRGHPQLSNACCSSSSLSLLSPMSGWANASSVGCAHTPQWSLAPRLLDAGWRTAQKSTSPAARRPARRRCTWRP